MARMPRLVVPGYPHHVTQRGARRLPTFFEARDYQYYLNLVEEVKEDAGVSVWAYCLMPNHVHLVVVPEAKDSLSVFFRQVHRRYTRRVNLSNDWQGHLWQERFHSFVMDERHLFAGVRYAELNPVRAGLAASPQGWPWSSVHAHLNECDDGIVTVRPMQDRINDWAAYLAEPECDDELEALRACARSGRPGGNENFYVTLEQLTGIDFRRGKPGPKRGIK